MSFSLRTLLFMAFMAGVMTFIITFVLTAARTGVDTGFLGGWMESWAVAFPTAFVAGLFVVPAVHRVVDGLVPDAASSSPTEEA